MQPTNTPTVTGDARPLPVLRAMIDAIDREMLQSLARRYALVAEIAQFKREHRLEIRDFAREAEILSDRCRRGAAWVVATTDREHVSAGSLGQPR